MSSALKPGNDAAAPPPATANLFLGALPGDAYRRLQPHLEPVALPLGQVISEPGERVNHVFFPTAGIVSLLVSLHDGFSVETAIIGNDSGVGFSSLLEGVRGNGPRYRRVVTMAGQAYRLRMEFLMQECERGGVLRHQLLLHIQAKITQIAQTAMCNRHHRLEMQVCRWVLMRLDRLVGSELRATHEQIANQLGVRREGVTEVASHLQSSGLIHYSRGRIAVLDRPGLEQRVCECYGVIEKEYARLLRARYPATGG